MILLRSKKWVFQNPAKTRKRAQKRVQNPLFDPKTRTIPKMRVSRKPRCRFSENETAPSSKISKTKVSAPRDAYFPEMIQFLLWKIPKWRFQRRRHLDSSENNLRFPPKWAFCFKNLRYALKLRTKDRFGMFIPFFFEALPKLPP